MSSFGVDVDGGIPELVTEAVKSWSVVADYLHADRVKSGPATTLFRVNKAFECLGALLQVLREKVGPITKGAAP